MKNLIFLAFIGPLFLTGCKGKMENSLDPRSIAYNDRAVTMMRNYVDRDDIWPDSAALAQCHSRTDTVRMMMKNIVDSCQILIDSALLYSPDQYFYYAQKATFYACGAYYEEAFQWINKAIEIKDIPELRLGAGMFLQKMGKEKKAGVYYKQAISNYKTFDTLSRADMMNYTLALSLSGEKEKARRTIDSLVKDTLLKRHLLLLTENPQEVIDATIP